MVNKGGDQNITKSKEKIGLNPYVVDLISLYRIYLEYIVK